MPSHFFQTSCFCHLTIFCQGFLPHAFSTFASRAFLFVLKITNKNRTAFSKLAKELKPTLIAKTLAKKFMPPSASWQLLCFTTVLFSIDSFSQIKQTQEPTFNQFQQVNPSTPTYQPFNFNRPNYTPSSTPTNNTYNTEPFKPTFTPPTPNYKQNVTTQQLTQYFSDIKETSKISSKKQLWELNLKGFKYANPNSAAYIKSNRYYQATYDSVNNMLIGKSKLDLKRAVFLVENTYFDNKAKYEQFCDLVAKKVYILKQIIKTENLDVNNNLALNYAIQKLFTETVKYKDKDGTIKYEKPFGYDFEDFEGYKDYTKQFVIKLLISNTGQCHSLPLLYLILANEIGAKANIAYSPQHSYIVFPDNKNNWYNFECTSGALLPNSFIVSSGYVTSEAIKSGIYTLPISSKELIANQLNDLATQHNAAFGTDDFQFKCVKRSLEVFPNNASGLMNLSNFQTAKTQALGYYSGFPKKEEVYKYPELKKEFDKRNDLYDYMDNIGIGNISEEAYKNWLSSMNFEKAKQESKQIKQLIIKQIKN